MPSPSAWKRFEYFVPFVFFVDHLRFTLFLPQIKNPACAGFFID